MSHSRSPFCRCSVAVLLFAPVFLACLLVCPTQVQGQSTIFIPTFRNFTYRGSVSVPDGGTIQMGSVGSSNEAANSSGVPLLSGIPGVGRGFRNRGIGREQQAGNLTTKATIIDMKELEADHLAKAGYGPNDTPRQNSANADVLRKARFLTENIGRRSSSRSQRDR